MVLYTNILEGSMEQEAFSTLIKRCAEMLKIGRELLPKFYKHWTLDALKRLNNDPNEIQLLYQAVENKNFRSVCLFISLFTGIGFSLIYQVFFDILFVTEV